MSSKEMKISSTFSEPTMNSMPTVASKSSAKYSPTCSVNVESIDSQAAKTVSSSTACLISCVKASITSIPCHDLAVVCCCTWIIQKMGSKQPTPNIERSERGATQHSSGRWMLDVGCWMFCF